MPKFKENTSPFKMNGFPEHRNVKLAESLISKYRHATKVNLAKPKFNIHQMIAKNIAPAPKPPSLGGRLVKAFSHHTPKVLKQVGRFLGGKSLGVAGMMMATSSKADQPKKGKGKREYPGGKIDFTK